MHIVYRAKDIIEAHIVAGLLVAEGLKAHVGGHYLQGAIGDIGVADFALVYVEDKDYLAARRLVDEYEHDRG